VWISSIGSVNVPSRRIDLFNYRTKHIVAQVTAGSRPDGLATSPDRRTLWVANSGASTVSVVDAVRRKVVATVHVGGARNNVTTPTSVAVSHDGKRAYVICSDDVMTVVDTHSHEVRRQIRFSGTPTSLAVSRNGRTAYVGVDPMPGHFSGAVDVVSLRTGRVAHKVSVPGGDSPIAMTLSSDGKRLYVATTSHILALNTATRRTVDSATVNGDYSPTSIAMLSTGNGVWVTLDNHNGHDLLDGLTDTLRYAGGVSFPEGSGLHDVHVTADGKYVVVTLTSENKVRAFKDS
jgi:YVTN family beta-propeller protein